MEELFRSLRYETLCEWIEERRGEDLHLDFKLVEDASCGRTDRKSLAKALSGFANADGGLLVWGVDCRRNEEGVDCAIGVSLIPEAIKFESRLNEFAPQVVTPVVEGVEHRRLSVEGDAGLVITHVPPSDTGPHMAKAGEDRYFKRSGASFLRMEHYEVSDMFGRRRCPRLRANIRLVRAGGVSGGGQPARRKVRCVVSLSNDGRGSAFAPFLGVRTAGPYRLSSWGIDGNGNLGMNRIVGVSEEGWMDFGGSTDKTLHPGTSIDVVAFEGEFVEGVGEAEDLDVQVRMAALDAPLATTDLQVLGGALIEFAWSR